MQFILGAEVTIKNCHPNLIKHFQKIFRQPNPRYEQAKRMGWINEEDPELFFWHQDDPTSITLPRGSARFVWEKLCAFQKPEYQEGRLKLKEVPFIFRGNLRPYQEEALQKIHEASFSTLVVPTGGGKTIIALASIAERRQPAIVICHTKELLYQWRDRAIEFLGLKKEEVGIVGDGHYTIKPLTIALVQTARKRLDDLPRHFGYIIVDECHRVPAFTFTETVSAFPAWYSLGLSATPYRRDGLNKVIGWYCGWHRVKIDQAELVNIGAVLRPKIVWRQTPFIYWYRDDYVRMISFLVENKQRNMLIVGDILRAIEQGRTCLVVSDRIRHLENLNAMTACGELLTGKTPKKKRMEIVEKLQAGRLHLVFSTLSLIGEGFDCPGLDTLFLASPIRFSGRLIQTIGRILRPVKGKEPLIYDYRDAQVGVLDHQAKSRARVYKKIAA